MRIALFHNLPSGGAKRAIFEWTRRLAKVHSIDVFTLSSANHDFCDIRPLVDNHYTFDIKPRRLFSSPFGRLNQLQRWRNLGELYTVEGQIADQIKSSQYDLLFSHTCQFTVIPILNQLVQTPSVYYLHEPFGQAFSRQIARPYDRNSPWRARLNKIDPLIAKYNSKLDEIQQNSINQTELLLSNSLFTQVQMRDIYEVEAPICHYGVDHKKFCPNPGIQKDFFLLSVGELSPRKGFDFLIESISMIPITIRPKLKLACNAVQEAEKKHLEDLANRHQVELELLHNQDNKQLALEYNRALFCVYSPVQEPFGLVPLEAMACGTAVIGVKEGGVVESIVHEHTGLLVERDPARFAEAIQLLLANPKLAGEYGRNGREHVLQNWTWDKAVDVLEGYLAEYARTS